MPSPPGGTASAVCTEGRTLPDRATHGRLFARADEPTSASTSGDPSPAASPKLDSDEELLVVVRGVGAVMFLTTHRVILARDGVERRPRTGIQSFRLETIRELGLELGSSTSGRIIIWTTSATEAVSMFVDTKALDRAEELVVVARPLIGG